ncbi:MAG: hypothetical protein WBE27_02275, partial [Microgenomates group bacterium]
ITESGKRTLFFSLLKKAANDAVRKNTDKFDWATNLERNQLKGSIAINKDVSNEIFLDLVSPNARK